MNRSRHVVLVGLLSIVAGATGLGGLGCTENPVGRRCDLGTASPNVSEVVLASPSLDCVSRSCLRVPLTRADGVPPGGVYDPNIGLCTAECSVDSDCDRVPESPCVTGFTCGIAVTVGTSCCRNFCICKDYIVVPESGQLPTPAACDPDNRDNKCCNLPGRAGNAEYPLCG